MLPLNLLPTDPLLITLTPILTCTDSFTYLGIKIYKTLPSIREENFGSMLSKIQLQLALLGRIAVIKLNLLLRITLLFSTLPLSLPPKFITNINLLCSKFIWNGKNSTIRLATLQRSKPAGVSSYQITVGVLLSITIGLSSAGL